MNQYSLIKVRDTAFNRIFDIFHDVTEGRWDNTHTAGQLRACVAMHEAACRQLSANGPEMRVLSSSDEALSEAIALIELVEFHDEIESRQLMACLEILKMLRDQGGAA